jgi:hypothetical protein
LNPYLDHWDSLSGNAASTAKNQTEIPSQRGLFVAGQDLGANTETEASTALSRISIKARPICFGV